MKDIGGNLFEQQANVLLRLRPLTDHKTEENEPEPTHEDCCQCQKCMGERYPCECGK